MRGFVGHCVNILYNIIFAADHLTASSPQLVIVTEIDKARLNFAAAI